MLRSLLLPLALFASRAVAQTYTECQPLNGTCGANPALGTTYNETFTAASTEINPQLWNITAGNNLITFSADGADMTLAKSKDSATAQSDFYIFFGSVEIVMKAAAGTGIISTVVLLSDDLDEVDFEIMGGNHSFVESNWYGHGNLSQFNALYHPVDGPQDKFHTYTFNWSKDTLQWLVDGQVVRSVPYAPTGLYPQTPSYVRFGVWAAGDVGQPEGTVTWAGGATDWSKGPFTMSVQSIKITDGTTNSSSYTYGDTSGSYQSIQVENGESAAYKLLNRQTTTQQVTSTWNGLSLGAKIGIAAGVGSVALIGTIAFCIFCFRQRKAGRAERQAADRAWEEQHAELLDYRSRMSKGGFAVSHMGHGEKM